MRTRGIGPRPAEIALVSDWPSRDDDRVGRPLSGKIGQEVNRHLEAIGLDCGDFFLVNLIRQYRPEGDYPASDVTRDAPELEADLAEVQPRVIVTLGRASARWALGDVDIDEVYALPWQTERGVVFPCYSPAAGFRNPDIQAKVAYGFQQFGAYLEGGIAPRSPGDDPFAGIERYIEIDDPADITINPALDIAIDSEGYPHAPYSVQYSQQAGQGYLIRARNRAAIRQFGEALRHDYHRDNSGSTRILFHNALHDLTILRVLGIDASDLRFADSMVQAYLLQVEPQGLKPLCVRHCGMAMQSYDEILGEAGNELARGYLVSLYDIEQADYEIRQHDAFERLKATPLTNADGTPKQRKDGTIRYHTPKTLPKVARTVLHKSVERVLRSKCSRKLWADQIDDVQIAAYNRLGPMDEPTLDHVDEPIARHYACRDSDGTYRLAKELQARIQAMGLQSVEQLEINTYPLIDRMGAIGLRPDLEHFSGLSSRLEDHIVRLRGELAVTTGNPEFNANSGDQVRALLFDDLGLPGSKRTRSGDFSTNDIVLEGLEKDYGTQFPVITTIREYREFYKLKHTFVDRIPDFVDRWPHDGRVHCTFRTTRVVTGRLAASDPNLLAMPKHGKFAGEFRKGWVAGDRHVLCSWDQSQIELRILAHLSQDPVLLAAYRDGLDLHARLAQRIFGGSEADHKKGTTRLAAKSVNFGLPMGMTCFGLAQQLRKNGLQVDADDAQRWIDETDALYTGIPVYKARMVDEARRNGCIRCLSGRIRYIGGIHSWDEFVRAEAERFAFSTPVQEGAQTVMKTAEAHVWTDVVLPLQREGYWVEPILQIHDDLLMEAQDDPVLIKRLDTGMRWAMLDTYKGLTVSLDTSGDVGHNWNEMEPICNLP